MWQHILSGRYVGGRKVNISFYLERHNLIDLSLLNRRVSSSVQSHMGEAFSGVFAEPLCVLTFKHFFSLSKLFQLEKKANRKSRSQV